MSWYKVVWYKLNLRNKIRYWRKTTVRATIPQEHVGRFIEIMSNFSNPQKTFKVKLIKRDFKERIRNPDDPLLLSFSISKRLKDAFELALKAFFDKFGINTSE